MGALDLMIAAPILAGSAWLLYRSFWSAGGACHGCSGGGCGSSRSTADRALVKLGGGRHR